MTGRRTAVTTVRVPTRLIIRESCGCQPYCTPLVVARDGGKAARSVGTDFEQAALVQAMADAASAELHHDSTPLISARCRSLVAGFLTSLHDDDPQPFGTALEQILQLGDATNEDAYAWQAAISVLREQGVAVLLAAATAGTHAQAECLIDQARVRISERLRRHHIQLQMRQAKLTDRLGTLTTGLLTALEPRQILQILAQQLPQLDIRHAHIALFAAEDNDPVPWSDLYIHVPGEAPVIRRFPSRHFPPPGLYNSAEPYSLALLPLIIEGGPSGFVAFDAAYLEPYGFIVRHLAAALRNSQLHAAGEAGRQLAEESSRLKSRFLATVSHELRMPLNLVVGLSEMLLREHAGSQALPQSVVQDLERIYGNAEHLGRMIGDVLDLASSEAGQLRLNREPLDLAEVLAVVAVTGAQMAQAKGLAWHTCMPTDGVQVWGDRTRLRQVVLNLISNAVKFTERGSVTLELSLADDVTVSVSDTGPGVPLQHQQQIFDEFHSSDRTMQRGSGGLGLGLTIGKHLIERHGGTLGVRSSGAEDSGSTFYFTLPRISSREPQTEQLLTRAVDQPLIVPSARDDSDDHRSTILHEPGVDLQIQPPGAKTILVVDDDPDTAALNMRVIRQQLPTCRVLQAGSGTEALALLEHLRPNLVLLDLVMPGLDGFGVLAAMRARAATLDVPVLVLTGRMLTEDDLARLHAGVVGILNKGLFNADEILEHIDAAIAQRRKLGSPTQQLVRRAAAFIRAHSAETLTRDQIAAYVGMSADHLTASFRQEMGVTPMAYLIRCRIDSARALLHESMRSITDVALDVGFADVASFSRAFHREVGVTPHAYRRSKRH